MVYITEALLAMCLTVYDFILCCVNYVQYSGCNVVNKCFKCRTTEALLAKSSAPKKLEEDAHPPSHGPPRSHRPCGDLPRDGRALYRVCQ